MLIAILPFLHQFQCFNLGFRSISEPKSRSIFDVSSRVELSRSVGTRGTTSILWIRTRSSETRISKTEEDVRRSPLSLKRLAQLSRLNGVKYHFEQSCVSRSRRRLAASFWRANFSLLSGGEIKIGKKLSRNELRISRYGKNFYSYKGIYLVRKICPNKLAFLS